METQSNGDSLDNSVLYVGVVDLSGFDLLRFNKGVRDTIYIEIFNAFTLTELL
jgi:hypothetical protein